MDQIGLGLDKVVEIKSGIELDIIVYYRLVYLGDFVTFPRMWRTLLSLDLTPLMVLGSKTISIKLFSNPIVLSVGVISRARG